MYILFEARFVTIIKVCNISMADTRWPQARGPRSDQDPGNLARGPERTMILTEIPRRIVPTVYNTQP